MSGRAGPPRRRARPGNDEEGPLDDRALMAIRADTDFTHDARGRMLLSNESRRSARRPAPRLFVGATTAGHVLRLGAALPDDLARRLAEVVKGLPSPDAIVGPPAVLPALREILAEHAPVTEGGGGPAFRFPAPIAQQGAVLHLTPDNRDLARDTFPWLRDEIDDWQPCFAVVRDGAAVSVCFSSRVGALAAEAGLETVPDFCGRGYAVAVTAAWGASVRAAGRVPLYSTAWDNLASRAVARRVGLLAFGADATLA